MNIDGCDQMVYINIKKDSYSAYDYGYYGESHSPRHDNYSGFIRSIKGVFQEVRLTDNKDGQLWAHNSGDVSTDNVRKLYSNIENLYRESVASLNADEWSL